MTTARERLFGNETKCDAGSNCILGGRIQREDDCFVVWIHRGNFPFLLGDLLSLEGEFEIYHADCMLPVKEGIEVRKEVKENERTNSAGTDKKENI